MREVVLDTETTGFEPETGDRIVEIGAVELVGHVATGRHFHEYINPERPMPEAAFAVHGLGDDFLQTKPVFAAVADEFREFIGDAPLVIHNAAFDMKFLNHELGRLGHPPMPLDRAVDTVAMARRKYPGSPASLDALCRRFGIDLSARTTHNALLDVQLLGQVYLELMGGKQPGLALAPSIGGRGPLLAASGPAVPRTPRPIAPSPEELERHAAFVAKLKDPVWSALDGG